MNESPRGINRPQPDRRVVTRRGEMHAIRREGGRIDDASVPTQDRGWPGLEAHQSPDPDDDVVPSADKKAAASTANGCALGGTVIFPVVVSQSRSIRSAPPVATSRPSGEKLAHRASSGACPASFIRVP